MEDSGSRAQGSRCYEQLKFMVVMNNSSYELKVIDAMNNSRLWMTWATLVQRPRALNAMKSLDLWMISITWDPLSSYELLKVVDDVNDSPSLAQAYRCYELLRLWMTWTTPGHELNDVNVINNSGLWITWMTLVHEIRPLNSMNS